MIQRKRHARPLRIIFAWPLAIFVLGIAGLVIALTGDGWPDGFSWLALALPVAVVVWAMRSRRS
jgi:CHASE2 domain-containing sensor protein